MKRKLRRRDPEHGCPRGEIGCVEAVVGDIDARICAGLEEVQQGVADVALPG
jgi:hypothetical protein